MIYWSNKAMKLIKREYRQMRAAIVFIVLLLSSIPSSAQPVYMCDDPASCAGGCKEDRVTCWDVDDPVPLDNGLLILVGAAVTYGLYKLNIRRQQA
jgi:hypothetical protein